MASNPAVASEPASAAPLMLSVSGCRGIVGRSLTPATISAFVNAFVVSLRERGAGGRCRVVLARDGRSGGDAVHRVTAGALQMCGCEVIDLGIATTPTAGHAVVALDADAGLVLTASHNPQQWNGLKAIDATGAAPTPQSAAALIEAFHAHADALVDGAHVGGLEANTQASRAHIDAIIGAMERLGGIGQIRKSAFSVVIDSVNASGSMLSRPLCEALGVRAGFVADDGTGVFPHDPEPIEQNLGSLAGAVTEAGAHIGFAQDPDADRLAIVDETGRFIGEEYTLALAAKSYLSAIGEQGASDAVLVANLSTSRMLDDVAAEYGARVVRSPVGEANVVAAMRAAGSVMGGEGNGGVIWPDVVWIRDSGAAIALVLSLMARTGEPISKLAESIPSYAIVKAKLPLGRREDAEPALGALVSRFDRGRADRQDGLRVDLDDESAWLHVRASNTEPILRVIAEAPSEATATALVEEATKVVNGS